MIEIFKTINGELKQLDSIEPGCWVNITPATNSDFVWLEQTLHVSPDFITAMRDRDEVSRADKSDDGTQSLVIVDFPKLENIKDKANPEISQYDTEPLSILMVENPKIVVTLSQASCDVVDNLKANKALKLDTSKRVCTLFEVLLEVSQMYISALQIIEKETIALERKMRKVQRSSGLISMLGIEKSLLYMSTSLKSSAATLDYIQSGQFVNLSKEDKEKFDDVLVEYKQATEMCTIYTDLIAKAMDAFSGVISNNVNVSMGILTTITLILSIPTVIFSFYGMNTNLLPLADTWVYPVLMSVGVVAIAMVILSRIKY